jgi:hypothetical protein
MNLDKIQSALMDAYDIRDALSDKVKNQPKDDDGTDITIGDCLYDIILTLEELAEESTI